MKPEPSGYFKAVDIPYPQTDEEEQLTAMLAALNREYQERCRPIYDRLGAIRAARPGNYALVPCDESEYGAFKIDSLPKGVLQNDR